MQLFTFWISLSISKIYFILYPIELSFKYFNENLFFFKSCISLLILDDSSNAFLYHKIVYLYNLYNSSNIYYKIILDIFFIIDFN